MKSEWAGIFVREGMATVLITGATGYLGRPLGETLVARGHRVRGLVRRQSLDKLPKGVAPIVADALEAGAVGEALRGCDTLVHLVGTPHPAPWKQEQFERVDAVSLRASADAAFQQEGRPHVVYVSVAHPAPVMRGYIQVRRSCEEVLASRGLAATVLRPWYVLGPGHRWPLVLQPLYWVAKEFEATREGAERLGLVWHREMVGALTFAVEHPARGFRVVEVAEIRSTASVAWAGRGEDRRDASPLDACPGA